MTDEPALRLRGITKRFAGLAAVDGVDLEVRSGEVHGLIGPNGAGKTTLFNLISGFLLPDEGTVVFGGCDIARWKSHRRAEAGIVRTFQNLRLFGGLTALQNILVGQHVVARPRMRSLWPFPTATERALRSDADDLLELFELTEYRDRRAADLPYGVQKRLEMARALASSPKLLLLDEPTAGMNDEESGRLVDEILAVRSRRVTVVLVEHDMKVVMRTSDSVTVLNFGKKIAEGAPESVQADPDVRLAYLGP